ncbi:MAG: FadR/GntR family transcriptional regulator [Pseudomonadota bacterium]
MVDLKLRLNKHERLADQLYGQLLESIVSGQLTEGDKLPSENQISRLYSVSRPVIREALLRLQADGLVYSRQGAGTFVKARPPQGLIQFAEPSDVAGLLRCFEARLPFEGAAAALAAQRATAEDLDRIKATFRELEAALKGSELADEADYAFHIAIARATGNEFFVSILASLNKAMIGGMRVALSISKRGSAERISRIREEHRAIVDAIATGDSAGADLAMRYHIHRARSRVTDHMRDR